MALLYAIFLDSSLLKIYFILSGLKEVGQNGQVRQTKQERRFFLISMRIIKGRKSMLLKRLMVNHSRLVMSIIVFHFVVVSWVYLSLQRLKENLRLRNQSIGKQSASMNLNRNLKKLLRI